MSKYIIRKWLYSYICIFFLIQPVIVKIPMILWAIWIIWILHFGKFDQGKKVELQIVLFLFSHFSFCGQKSALWLKISLISFEAEDLDWRKVHNFFLGFYTVFVIYLYENDVGGFEKLLFCTFEWEFIEDFLKRQQVSTNVHILFNVQNYYNPASLEGLALTTNLY